MSAPSATRRGRCGWAGRFRSATAWPRTRPAGTWRPWAKRWSRRRPELNAEARAEPGGDANLQLGYLLGAAERGAERTEGIHADLVRRLTVAARYAPAASPLPPAFLAAYRQGYDAGHARG